MTLRTAGLLRLASPLMICVFLPGSGLAQDIPPYPNPYGGTTILKGPRRDIAVSAGAPFGPGFYGSGWPYGPTVAPDWGYPGLYGGPFVGYPFGYYYGPRAGAFWSNGLSLYGPPVPTYGPIPGFFGNYDQRRLWEQVPSPGIPFGWVGIYAASPRPRFTSVDVWPVERIGQNNFPNNFDNTNLPSTGLPTPLTPTPVKPPVPPSPPAPGDAANPPPRIAQTPAKGASLVLSVKVPQFSAQVFVDGVKTNQIGTDRIFDSPPLDPTKEFRYEVTARWIERGVMREAKRIVTGTPGEVVRVDFTQPEPTK